jgi:PAS domain S-box-containing protein
VPVRQRGRRGSERGAGRARDRREAEALAALGGLLSETLDPDVVGQRIADTVRGLLGTCSSALYHLDPESDGLVAIAVSGHTEPAVTRGTVFPRGTGVVALAMRERGPVWTPDLLTDPRVALEPTMRARARLTPYRSVLAVPLMVEDRVIGALGVGDAAGRVFDDGQVRTVEAFAAQAALALRNARLHRESEQRRREAEVFARLVRQVNASLDLAEVLQQVAEAARELCDADFARIALREEAADRMRFHHWAGPVPEEHRLTHIERGKGVGGLVLASGRPVRTNNYADDPRITKDYLPTARATGIVAVMCVPIRVEDRIDGLLFVDNHRPAPFTDRDEAILLQLADHVAMAIRNARLFASEQTARAEAEAAAVALRASEEQYRALAEGSIQGLYIHQDGMIQFANASMAGMFGYDGTDELLGRPYLLLLAPEEHARIESYRAARLRGDPAPTRYEARGIRRDGGRIWIEVVVSLVPWKGQPAVLGTFLDITERRRAADALRRSEQENARLFREAEHRKTLLEQVFASTSDGILVLDLEGRITALNRRGGDLLGVSPEAAAGQPLAECLGRAGDWSEPGACALTAAVMAATETLAGDLETRAPRLRTLQWQSAPTRDAAGAAVGVTVTLRDVTKEREVSRMKSDFVSFVIHQLRTPLSGIRWMLELGAQEDGIPAQTAACLADARQAAERLIGLVNDLLDISRLESGRMSVDARATDLGELTESVVGELGPLVREHGHRLSVGGADATPAVTADPQLLRQVMLNLISNAIKYQHPGGEIAIRMGRDSGVARWEVRDRGIGIPPEARHRLFEKFFRAENAASVETEGTGLGLYLVHLIVERLGGGIRFESEEGAGSTFVVTLPIWESEAS